MSTRPVLTAVFCSLAILGSCEKKPATPESADSAANTPATSPAEPTNTEPTLATNEPTEVDPVDLADSPLMRYGIAEATPTPPGEIRLATYNIENLFDNRDDPNLSGRYEDIDDTKPVSQLQAVAETIRILDADIIALEEIESLEAITEFRDQYLSDMGYKYLVSLDAGDERGIEQAVLSRFPIVETQQWIKAELGGTHPELYGDKPNWFAGEPIRFHRSPLLVTVEVPGEKTGGEPYQLTLLAVHQKSGRFSDYWREKEAAATMEIIQALQHENPSRNIIILGDFNAQVSDDSIKTYLESGMHDLFEGRTGDEIVTHTSGRRIDLILANDAVMGEIDPSASFVLSTVSAPEGMSWDDAHLLPGYASDHFPVAVDITPREKSAGG
jgi:endonuclease/exonuclease/phosphatase family metal-dependent hydrolase